MSPTLMLALALAGGAMLGWLLARLSRPGMAWVLMALTLSAALALALHAQAQPGLSGMPGLALAVYLVAPAGLGIALGVIVETLRRRLALRRSTDANGGDDGA